MTTTKKTYAEAVQTLDDDGDYTKPWKLDSGSTGNFAGTQTGILNRTTVTNGFKKVMVANGDKITQQAEGRVPFNVPDTAAPVAVFDHMPNALLAAGPLVKAGCCIILDTP